MVTTARITYYPDSEPGITRARRGRGFSYLAADGTRIADPLERDRLAAVAVPPAYESVWLSPIDHGHLRATGRDERGRKQYLYHPDWRRLREERKFDRLADFGASLPTLRSWIERHLAGDVGEKTTAIAAVLALLDRASLRPGDPRNTRDNKTFGATTLRNRHLAFDGEMIHFDYQAKGGKQVKKQLRGSRLARVLEASRDLPGAALISWIDDGGKSRVIRSDDVNDTLAEISGEQVTAKTFRTWNGTHAAFMAALESSDPTISKLATAASERLHNTPTIARNSYIHPRVIDITTWNTRRIRALRKAAQTAASGGYRSGEHALFEWLQEG